MINKHVVLAVSAITGSQIISSYNLVIGAAAGTATFIYSLLICIKAWRSLKSSEKSTSKNKYENN